MPVIDAARWEQGLTIEQWIEHGHDDHHKGQIARTTAIVTIPNGAADQLASLPATARLLIISEECGSDTLGTSVMARLAALAGDRLEVRIFPKADHPDLMEAFLREGTYASVPVYVALDADFEQVDVMWEHAPGFDAWVQQSLRDFVAEAGGTADMGLHNLPREQASEWVRRYREHFTVNHEAITADMAGALTGLITASAGVEPVRVRARGG
jgi:hypothetical protein